MHRDLHNARRKLTGKLLSSGKPPKVSPDGRYILPQLPALDGEKRTGLNARLTQAEELSISSLFVDTPILRYLVDVEQAARELLRELDR
jgi:hypothetical protein